MVRWLSRYFCDLDNLGLRLLVEEPYEVLVRASYGPYEALTSPYEVLTTPRAVSTARGVAESSRPDTTLV